VKTLYRATRVHTMGHPEMGEWVLVDGRHVQRVGSGEPPRADRVVELPGATLVPGFVDAHVHLTSTGVALQNADVERVASKEELLALASVRSRESAGPVVLLQGFDETRWPSPELPRIEELDAVADRPLVLTRVDGHVALANAAAVAWAGLGGIEGCERDEDGPTGRVVGEANGRLARAIAEVRPDHRIEELQLAAAAVAAAQGVTSVHEMALPHANGERDLEVLLRHRARLPVDAFPVLGSMDVPRAVELGLTAIGGDLAADGSIGARTAALGAPYEDAEGAGTTFFSEDELTGFFRDAHDAGLQVGMHAIGDRGIELVLASWERVDAALDSRQRRHFRARRHRIEHLEMPSEAQIERAAMLGLAASVQPAFDARWGDEGGLYAAALGAARAASMNPFRSLRDRGVTIGVGSDAPITPIAPWRAVEAMERHHDPAQRLDRRTAFRAHTAGSARLAHQEEKKGTLEPGFHADLVAYDEDPFDAGDLGGLRPILTVSLGREVFAA
jgi:predicted amidohydrolase YtcJ